MHKGKHIVSLVMLFALLAAPLALAGESDEFGLSHEDMMDKNKVIVYLDHHPEKVHYLPKEVVLGLLSYIEVEEYVATGYDLYLLHRVKFILNMYLLDLMLDEMLSGDTLTPEGYEHEPKAGKKHHGKGKAKDGVYVNTAEVTAKGPIDTVVYDDDKAVVEAMHPGIDITKSPKKQMVVSGKAVEFEVTVTNTGDVELYKIHVMDPQAPNCETDIDHLYPGESVYYYCEVIAYGDFNNIATVTGYDPHGGAVVDTDEAYVDAINPSIKVEKTPSVTWTVPGKPVVFTITVTNTGDVPLYDVQISDKKAPQCERLISHLEVLASISYDCIIVIGEEGYGHSEEHYQMDHYEDKGHGHKDRGGHKGDHRSGYDSRYGELVGVETFGSKLGCELHQQLAMIQSKGTGLYISPCDQNEDGEWNYKVWKAS